MAGPLDGFRVVDLTRMLAGPWATMMLGDQGADVIKVEAPGGDHTRALGNRGGGLSASFLNLNRNKRSVVIDLKTESGRDLVRRLATGADVFVQNFRPGGDQACVPIEPGEPSSDPRVRLFAPDSGV